MFYRFQCRTTEAAKLEAELSKAQKTLKAAEVLINQLDREHKRWSTQVGENFHNVLLIADILISPFLSEILLYLGEIGNPLDTTLQSEAGKENSKIYIS